MCAHCLSAPVCLPLRQKKMGVKRGRDSEMGGERDEDRGLGHLLLVHCVCQDLLLMGAPSAWGLAPLLTPQRLQMKTHCLFCSPCSCACVCVFSSRLVLVDIFNSSLCMDFHRAATTLIDAQSFCLNAYFEFKLTNNNLVMIHNVTVVYRI